MQAQDRRGFRLAIRARTRGLSAADVDRALTDERTLVVDWLNRGTLHLVRAEDHAWLHALTAPRQLTGSARRLRQEGVDERAAERGVRTIERSLAHGPLTRAQLRERLESAGVPTAGQALIHVIALACLRGIAVRGPVADDGAPPAGAEQAYVLRRDWLGEPPPVDRDAALAELAGRYLAGHGPASDRDLARWSGLPLRDARAGLAAIGPEGAGGGLLDLPGRPAPADAPPRLLGPFEPVLLGWESRDDVAGGHESALVSGGVFRPFALVGGRAAATWSLADGRLALEPFRRLSRADATALEADAAGVERFLGS